MTKKGSFLKTFLKDRQVGAMSPSSRFLANKMLENINFDEAKVIIELGPGTGVFTHVLLEKMRPDATLLVFELNTEFYTQLTKNVLDPRAQLIHDSAEKIEEYLHQAGFQEADAIVSSLPLAMFSSDLRKNILNASKSALKTDGKYIQFQYSLQSKKKLEKTFDKVSIRFTPLNFPPAFIYTCTKTE
jgi:phosphatidylethanolamine/phosphatidyl-N-methylethanolamine N-methyltransferase